MTRIAELKKRWMDDPEFEREYEKANEEFALIEALISARSAAKLSQAELAAKLGTTQSSIARLEGGGVVPTLATLRNYAAATGMELHVELVPRK